jgi:hypothetical protein
VWPACLSGKNREKGPSQIILDEEKGKAGSDYPICSGSEINEKTGLGLNISEEEKDRTANSKDVHDQIGEGENEGEIEKPPLSFFSDLRCHDGIRRLVPEESQDGKLKSVLDQDHEKSSQWRKQKEDLPTPLGEDIIPLESKELKRREGIEQCNHDKTQQIGPQVPNVETEERRHC